MLNISWDLQSVYLVLLLIGSYLIGRFGWKVVAGLRVWWKVVAGLMVRWKVVAELRVWWKVVAGLRVAGISVKISIGYKGWPLFLKGRLLHHCLKLQVIIECYIQNIMVHKYREKIMVHSLLNFCLVEFSKILHLTFFINGGSLLHGQPSRLPLLLWVAPHSPMDYPPPISTLDINCINFLS